MCEGSRNTTGLAPLTAERRVLVARAEALEKLGEQGAAEGPLRQRPGRG